MRACFNVGAFCICENPRCPNYALVQIPEEEMPFQNLVLFMDNKPVTPIGSEEDWSLLYSIPGGLGRLPRAMLKAEFDQRMGEGTYVPKTPSTEAGSIFFDCHTPAHDS